MITGMKRNILHILLMLLALPAAFSCDSFISMDEVEAPKHGGLSLIINGTVSDSDTSMPIEGVKISFRAYPKNGTTKKPLAELNVYTDNNGVYSIESQGFSEELTCIVQASDPEGVYTSAEQEVGIPWSGTAFDEGNDCFIVNDCDFKLTCRQ